MSWWELLPDLQKATEETLYMVGVSTLFTVLLGLPLGILLVLTEKEGLLSFPIFHAIAGFIVNVGRSLPFIILLVALIPFTRTLVGTSIGTDAAIVPLTIAAIPFFARIAETSLREVDGGVIEAARAMGTPIWQIILKVLIPEALPSIILGITITVISLISYSAIAGTIGAGGLGNLAITYGYLRFENEIMVATVVILFIIVQGVQVLGNSLALLLARRWK